MKIPATGLVLTLNGERWIAECIKSLSFCRHVLVVDSESSDRTIEIAEKYGARILVNPWPGPIKQFEFAFRHINTPWVVSLDQDEIISDNLRQNLLSEFKAGLDPELAAYYCSRASFYFDRFLKHCGWYPDYLLRVFRLDQIETHHSGPHYGFHTSGKTRRLNGDIIHYPYANLQEHVNKINYYTQVAAEEMHGRGKKGGLLKAIGHAKARFFKIYFLKLGFLDGRAGLILAVNSFFYTFQKYIRLMELRAKKNNFFS